MKRLISYCKNWLTEHYQGTFVGWPPGINFGKKKEENTIKDFEILLIKSKWKREFIEHKEIWVAEQKNTFQIECGELGSEFHEPWTEMYPDKSATKYPVYLKINNTKIKELAFVSVDGGRIFVPMPERKLKNGKICYFWDIKSLPLKICNIIGDYYIYKDIYGVAQMSKIEIINHSNKSR